MAENYFDRFDAAPPGVDAAPSGGNVFDQYDSGQPAVVEAAPREKTYGESVSEQTSNAVPYVTDLIKKYGPRALDYIERTIREAAPSLYTQTYENPMLGAEQKAVPHPSQYGEPLATAKDMFRSDSGEISFRDAQGNVIPAENDKHVMLVGPDGNPAIYARTDKQTEAPIVGASRVLSLGLGSNAPTTVAKLPGAVRPSTEVTLQGLKEASVGDRSKGITGPLLDPAIQSRAVNPGLISTAIEEVAPQLRETDPAIVRGILEGLSDLRGNNVRDLNIASERLGSIAKKVEGPVGSQTATKEAAIAQIIKGQIDKVRDAVAPEQAAADANYSALKSVQTITGRENVAKIKSQGGEGDFAAKMQKQAESLLLNPKYTRGLQPEELDRIRAISEGRIGGERLRAIAPWLADRIAKIGMVGGGAIGLQDPSIHGIMTGAGAALSSMAIEPLVSSFVTRLGNRATANQINGLLTAIRERSPLQQQLIQNLQNWEQAWRDIKSAPSYAARVTLGRSAYQLSNALRSAGVNIHPAELMRVQAPGTSDANENQVPRPVGQ